MRTICEVNELRVVIDADKVTLETWDDRIEDYTTLAAGADVATTLRTLLRFVNDFAPTPKE